MNDLRDLYQEVILDHARRPRNKRVPEGANRHAEGINPVCGDRITVHLALAEGRVRDVGFEGSGCAISTASASTMTEVVKGKTVAEVELLFARLRDLVMGKGDEAHLEELGKLAAFSGVSEFPLRVKCATLAWHALHEAVAGGAETVSTE